jgi:uncharacterized membrane protein
MVSLGDIPGGEVNGVARSISDDGSVIVGWGQAGYAGVEAIRWRADGTIERLGDLAGGELSSSAHGVSADGSVVAGMGTTSNFISSRPVFWTPAIRAIGQPAGQSTAVSDDGNSIVGVISSGLSGRAFLFRPNGSSLTLLEDLPGGGISSSASGISGNGTVIVGRSSTDAGNEAVRWSLLEATIALGDLPGGAYESLALDVSNDGEVIVGRGTTELGTEAFVWSRSNGMVRLTDILALSGVATPGWVLHNAFGVSADGRWVVGEGTNPNGNLEAFIAEIRPVPMPGTAWLFASAVGLLGAARRISLSKPVPEARARPAGSPARRHSPHAGAGSRPPLAESPPRARFLATHEDPDANRPGRTGSGTTSDRLS